MELSPVHQVWPKPSCKAQWRGEEDKADRRRGRKTTSGNGQAWSSPNFRGQWRTEKWRKLVVKSSVVPQQLPWLKDRWRWRSHWANMWILSSYVTGFQTNNYSQKYTPPPPPQWMRETPPSAHDLQVLDKKINNPRKSWLVGPTKMSQKVWCFYPIFFIFLSCLSRTA